MDVLRLAIGLVAGLVVALVVAAGSYVGWVCLTRRLQDRAIRRECEVRERAKYAPR